MTNGNKKKNEQLGMPAGTATARLKKLLMFSLVKECNKDICYRCGKKIEDVDNFSIEHKTPWLNAENPVATFFDLDNIAYSHLNCNISAASKDIENIKKVCQESYKRGARHSKFNENDIKIIRELLKTKSQAEVAKMYGASKFSIYRIANGISFEYIK